MFQQFDHYWPFAAVLAVEEQADDRVGIDLVMLRVLQILKHLVKLTPVISACCLD